MQLRPLPYLSGKSERGYKRVKVKALIKCRGRLVVGRQPAKLFGRFRPPWVQFPLPALNITMDYLSGLSDLGYDFPQKIEGLTFGSKSLSGLKVNRCGYHHAAYISG